jgi:hypothetical protein
VNGGAPDYRPDIVAVGFQEIVPLNAGSVIGGMRGGRKGVKESDMHRIKAHMAGSSRNVNGARGGGLSSVDIEKALPHNGLQIRNRPFGALTSIHMEDMKNIAHDPPPLVTAGGLVAEPHATFKITFGRVGMKLYSLSPKCLITVLYI